MRTEAGGVFGKYFDPGYDPWRDRSWPELEEYDLDQVMVTKDNALYRAA